MTSDLRGMISQTEAGDLTRSAGDGSETPSPDGAKGETAQSFDVDKYLPKSSSVATWLAFTLLPKVLWLARAAWPIPRLPGWAAATRYDDVAEVLSRHDVFRVPYADEMTRLNDDQPPGTPFILGMDDARQHDAQLRNVMRAFKREDAERIVRPLSFDFARKMIDSCKDGQIEAIGKLITGVPLHICSEYYGLEIPGNPRDFAYAAIVVSKHLFGKPPIEREDDVEEAANYFRSIVNNSIHKEKESPSGRDTVLARLGKLLNKSDNEPDHLPREQIRAFLMGMIVGFVPTTTIAGGHILEMLLRKKDFEKACREAVISGDDDLLRHCLFEAMRFMPLNPGPFRECERDHILAAGTPRAAKIRKGTRVLASTMSAMFDSRQVEKPFEFNPHRPASDYMLFGYGMHWCAGVFIAQTQITQTLKALLLRPTLKRVSGKDGAPRYRGFFPDHLCVRFR